MELFRLLKVFSRPAMMLFAQLYPVQYAKYIGVDIRGKVKIYGSSYVMFSAEPYLVTLHDNVYISLNANFICHDGGILPFRKDTPDLDVAARIIIGKNTFIGMGVCVLPGVTVGDNCVVGAQSVVTKDVPSGTVVAGNPAVKVKTTQEYLEKCKTNSLHIGRLYGEEKIRAYKNIFGINK